MAYAMGKLSIQRPARSGLVESINLYGEECTTILFWSWGAGNTGARTSGYQYGYNMALGSWTKTESLGNGKYATAAVRQGYYQGDLLKTANAGLTFNQIVWDTQAPSSPFGQCGIRNISGGFDQFTYTETNTFSASRWSAIGSGADVFYLAMTGESYTTFDAVPGSTGTQYYNIGFEPTCLFLFGVLHIEDAFAPGFYWYGHAVGWTDFTKKYSHSCTNQLEDNLTTQYNSVNARSHRRDDYCIGIPGRLGGLVAYASPVSTDSNGFTLNWHGVDAGAKCAIVALSKEVAMGHVSTPTSPTTTQTISLPWKAGPVLFASQGSLGSGSSSDALLAFGGEFNIKNQTNPKGCVQAEMEDLGGSVGTLQGGTVFKDDTTLEIRSVVDSNQNMDFTIDAFNGDGIDLDYGNTGSQSNQLTYLAFKQELPPWRGWTDRGRLRVLQRLHDGTALPGSYKVHLCTEVDEPGAETVLLSELTQIANGNGYSTNGIDVAISTSNASVADGGVANKATLTVSVVVTATGNVPASGNPIAYVVLTDDNATVANREVLYFWGLDRTQTMRINDELALNLKTDIREGA